MGLEGWDSGCQPLWLFLRRPRPVMRVARRTKVFPLFFLRAGERLRWAHRVRVGEVSRMRFLCDAAEN
jgi:hypothetical protein